MFEDGIDHECAREVRNDQPRGPPRRSPQIKPFIDKEHSDEQTRRDPFIAQASGPVSDRMKKLACEISHEHERAGEAKEVSGKQEDKNQGAAKVYPRKCRGDVLRRQHRTKQSVKNHGTTDDEEGNLKQRSRVLPGEQFAKKRNTQQIDRG